MRNAWLTATGFDRPGIPEGLLLSEAELLYEQIEQYINETRWRN